MSQNAVLFFIFVKIIAISYCSPLNKYKNVEMHPNCSNRTYCFVRGDDYPEALIEYLVNRTEISKIDIATPEHRQTSHNIVNPCEVDYSVDPIYQVRDVHGNVRYVVQATRIKQIIQVASCKNKGEITQNQAYLNVEDLKRDYYTAYCVESYTNYRFLVLGEDGTGLESVRVKGIPVCCRCEIHPTDENVTFLTSN